MERPLNQVPVSPRGITGFGTVPSSEAFHALAEDEEAEVVVLLIILAWLASQLSRYVYRRHLRSTLCLYTYLAIQRKFLHTRHLR